MLDSTSADGNMMDSADIDPSQLVGHIMYSFWDAYGWCRGMILSEVIDSSNPELNIRILYDDGEEEVAGVPDPGIKVFDKTHESFVDQE